MIDWKRYFDKIVVLHYVKNDMCKNRLISELDRVGIMQSGICHIHENIQSPFFKILQKTINYDKMSIQSDSNMSCAFGHYHILKAISLQGHRKSLILEDDVVFHKDFNVIQDILEKMPNDLDVCLLSHFMSPSNSKDMIRRYINEMTCAKRNGNMFIPFDYDHAPLAGAHAYVVSLNGSIALAGLQEHCFQQSDLVFREQSYNYTNAKKDPFHTYVLQTLKKYYCRLPICMQKPTTQSMTELSFSSNFNIIMNAQRHIMSQAGIDFTQY